MQVIAYDPGLATGVAWGSYTHDTPLMLLGTVIRTYEEMRERVIHTPAPYYSSVVVEWFESRSGINPPDLSGVRVEGMLEAYYHGDIIKRSPARKEQVPDAVLKEHGLWQTGSTTDWEDGRDANDAIIHLLGYVAFDLQHRPTLKHYFGGHA